MRIHSKVNWLSWQQVIWFVEMSGRWKVDVLCGQRVPEGTV